MKYQGLSGAESSRRRRKTCLWATLGIIIALVVLIIILAFTVFKAKRPVTTINSVTLQDMSVALGVVTMTVKINVTVDADITIKNPNRVGFKYNNATASLNYRGQQVGVVPVPAGKISAGETMPMNVSLTVMADRLLSNSQAYADTLAGKMPMNTFVRVSGKVNILGIKKHVVSESSCDFDVYIVNRTIGEQNCKYKTKL
ncbi:hypothetical protein Tsubulata_000072 [Turnera subulata]|uniref:Late embryogenesis abundant protein LEA-2 subgroup domain-containing protein n=1 Tax=Turnera subulata TaxID=218843 RepID=A0A9Q0J8R0_9ROSI|nr:hypothetical protein Tsubulata_000072 [Turnera subulata]